MIELLYDLTAGSYNSVISWWWAREDIEFGETLNTFSTEWLNAKWEQQNYISGVYVVFQG